MSGMRALRLHGIRNLRLHEEPIPEPRSGEVQVQIKSVGICASDLHYYRDGRIGTTVVTDPIVLGHEASGVISALGEGVIGLKIGDRVAIEPAKPCMECEYCKSGHYNVCPGIPFFGAPPTDGCFRDYITWPARLLLKIPDSLTFDEAAMAEPLAIGIYAVELADLKPGNVVAILGVGAIGLSVLQAAKVVGVNSIIVSEPIPERRKLALKLGADKAIDPGSSNLEAEIGQFTGGRGVDVAFECAGEDDAVRQASRIAAILGKVIILGIPDGNDYPFDASSARRKQLTAIFVRRSNLTTEKAIDWIAKGKADVACYATHRFPLEETEKAMELAIDKRDGVIRAMIVVNE